MSNYFKYIRSNAFEQAVTYLESQGYSKGEANDLLHKNSVIPDFPLVSIKVRDNLLSDISKITTTSDIDISSLDFKYKNSEMSLYSYVVNSYIYYSRDTGKLMRLLSKEDWETIKGLPNLSYEELSDVFKNLEITDGILS